MFDTLEMIYVFFTSSTKRYLVFRQEMEDKDIEGAVQLRNLSLAGLLVQSQLWQFGRVLVV
jgi:hypothetical protein